MKPIISVVVPIYNTEKYLEKCLNSILNQTLKEIEIICIDDCSSDNSCEIVEKFASKDTRINLIHHKKNLGPGGVRNTAIRAAKADYIASVDSDDSILPNMLEILWREAEKGKYDIICCGFIKVDESGNKLDIKNLEPRVIINKNNSINIFSLNPGVCNKLIRRSLFIENNIFFPDHMYFEDMTTTPCLVAKSQHIKLIDDVLYHYTMRPASITSSYSTKHILDYFKGFEILWDFLEKNKLIKRYEDEFIAYVNINMRFHSQKVLNEKTEDCNKLQYLRHLLMLKIGFLECYDLVKSKKIETLLTFLESAKTKKDLIRDIT